MSKRAIIVGLEGKDWDLIANITQKYGYTPLHVYPHETNSDDLIVSYPGATTPKVLDRALLRIRRRTNYRDVGIIFLGELEEKMYIYDNPVIPLNVSSIDEAVKEYAEKRM